MSVSSLPEWKQLLLEKKRREEEERERREKEEEEKFASMPAWKRGIIQRRKAKSPSDVNLGSELSLSPDPGQWLDADPKPVSQVSVETIVPVHENPFILTQSAWRKSRDGETGNEPEVKERDKLSPRSQDGELGRGRDIELKKERFRDLSEGREKDRSRDRSQGRERENSREGCEKEKNCHGGRQVERRDSWRIGKPLSRIESLREKIRQRELEKQRQGEGSEAAEISDTQTAGDRYEERGTEIEKQWEATAHVQKRPAETEQGQEEAAAQTSVVAFDVTQEVAVLKTCPQLPVSVLLSQAVRGEEVTSERTARASEATSEALQISEDEDGPVKDVEEPQRRDKGRNASTEEEQEEEEGKELSEEEVEEYTSPLNSTQSLSPSPPLPNSLAAMSRIYNLETGQTVSTSAKTTPQQQTQTVSTSAKIPPQQQTQTAPAVTEPGKKKYPTVEEIEVIGGYQNLEKSCLVKNRGTPKKVSGNCVVTLLL
uniref:Phostensin/Taperin N-terminal domain-containing protein n=1 Tax=Oreochromis niloticus TaxID=8128 RepID=A0A669CU38_ORENI